MRFDFNEANILKQNLFSQDDTKEILLYRLARLSETTEEQILRTSVSSLIEKVERLSPQQVKQIQSDIFNKRLIATSNLDYGGLPITETK